MLSFKEALKGGQHKIDKNKNGKIDAHDFKLLRKEEQEISEGTVKTQKYSWGTMKTVHHGADFSIPLHPEHHQAIAKLKDQQEHKFKDETGRHWTAKRDGDKVHFQGANNGGKTSVPHSTMKEEVEIDESAFGRDKMANMRAAHDRHMEKALAANKAGDDTAVKVHQSKMAMLRNKMDKLKQNEEVELELSDLEGLDEADKATGGLKDACWKGYTAVGMKMKNGKKVPNCVPVKEEKEEDDEEDDDEEKCKECGMPEDDCECDHEDEKEMKEAKKKMTKMCEGKHVIGVTVSNPNHPAVTQRNEKKFRKAKVSAPDKDTAINTALAYYKKRGYKVHDHNYVGLHTEEYVMEIDEAVKTTHEDPLVTVHDKDGLHTHANLSTANKIFGTSVKHTEVHKGAVSVTSGRDDKNKLKFAISKHHASALKEAMTHEVGVSYDKNSMRAQGKVRVTAKDHEEAKSKALESMRGREKNVKVHSSRNLSAGKETDSVKFKEDLDEARINGREYASQGVMHPDHAKMDIHKVSGHEVDFYANKTGDKMQGKVVKNDGKSVHIQAHKELGDGKLHKFKVTPHLPKKVDEQAPVAPTLDRKYIKGTPEHKAYKATKKPINGHPTNNMKEESELDEKMDLAKADMGDVIKDFKQSDAPQFAGKSAEKRRQMAIAAKLQADRAQKEEREVKKFKQFREEIYKNLPMIEEEIEEVDESVEQLDEIEFDKSGRYVHKGSYGSSYQGDDDDDDTPKKKPAPTGEKRGRGRPAGSTSGARQKGAATGKKRTGVEYTGYPLHLPNSNK